MAATVISTRLQSFVGAPRQPPGEQVNNMAGTGGGGGARSHIEILLEEKLTERSDETATISCTRWGR